MTEKELKECWFINDEMKFYTYKDFLDNCVALKKLYNKTLSKYGKLMYKWYLYANIHLTIQQKNKAWGYLNNDIDKTALYQQAKGTKNSDRNNKDYV